MEGAHARVVIVVAAVALAAPLAGALLGGCPKGDVKCTSDSQCDLLKTGGNACDLATGTCKCTGDAGCSQGEICNSAGRCQASGLCITNEDCGTGLFCDVKSGACIADQICGEGRACCTADDQCPFKSICDVVTSSCVAGCRDSADCLIGQGCVGAAFGTIGHCSDECTQDSQCGFGQLCNISTGDCQDDHRGPYCLGCAGGVQSDDCGTPGNFCLLDTVNGGSYCGVDCSDDQACPNGYECRDVIILPRSTLPTCALPEKCNAGTCARTGVPCTTDESCPEGPPGSDCPRADVGNCQLNTLKQCVSDGDCTSEEGPCLKQECRGREGASFGVCSCTKNTDCPSDQCRDADVSDPAHPVEGHCELSGHRCFVDAECDVITCVEGGCLIGRNCKPGADRTCADFVNIEPPLTGSSP